MNHMNPRQVINGYYGREEIQKAMIAFGKDREVVGVYRSGSFSKRPNVIVYPKEIMAMVKTGIMEFHSSVERWKQPMGIREDNQDSLRKGWDLIFDVDCSVMDHGRIASEILIWALKKHGIKNISVKFTGGTGFHIGVPWESMPKTVDYRPGAEQYPGLARDIARYIREYARDRMEKVFLDKYGLESDKGLKSLASQINKPTERLQTKDGIDPYQIADIDPILISPRHLFRMPYSLNRKSLLVSLPFKVSELHGFKREMARPEKVKPDIGFLEGGEEGEAELLIAESTDWKSMRRKKKKKSGRIVSVKGEIQESMFPPCIKNINKGLRDGRKRSLFILINFLRTMNWRWEKIKKYAEDWNSKNKPPLHENYLRAQLRWHSSRKEKIPPPNCEAQGKYIDMGICEPDNICGGESRSIKNPVNYSKKLYFRKKPKNGKKRRKRKRKDPMDYPVAKP